MKKFLAALIVSLFTTTAAQATEWVTDMENSRLGFQASQLGAPVLGVFNTFTAQITFDPDNLAASKVVVDIDMKSVDTVNAERDQNIVGPEWFATGQFPMGRFETTSFEADGNGGFIANARLTMRDVTMDVSLPFSLEIDGNRAMAKGELQVMRLDYGIGQGQWQDVSAVGNEVVISFDLTATSK